MSDTNNDAVQHGIDDTPSDTKKGLELEALGAGAIGAMSGPVAGPIGAVTGALIGGSVGSLVSGAAVQTVDSDEEDDGTFPGLRNPEPTQTQNDNATDTQ